MNGIQEVSGSIPLISTKKIPQTIDNTVVCGIFAFFVKFEFLNFLRSNIRKYLRIFVYCSRGCHLNRIRYLAQIARSAVLIFV